MRREEVEELIFTKKYAEWLKNDIKELTESIEKAKQRIITLEEKAEPQSPCTEDKPRSTSPVNKLDIIVPAIADEKAALKEKLELLETRKKIFYGTMVAYEQKINEIEAFISEIDDQRVKLIVKLRCIEQLTWSEILDELGVGYSEEGIKKTYYRFFDKQNEEARDKTSRPVGKSRFPEISF